MKKRNATAKRHSMSTERQAEIRFPIKKRTRALIMAAIFVFAGVSYYALLRFCLFWVTPVLYIATAVLFLTFFFINRGFSSEPISEDRLPENWSAEKKKAFVEEDIKRKLISRWIMLAMVPLLFLVAADILYLTFFV